MSDDRPDAQSPEKSAAADRRDSPTIEHTMEELSADLGISEKDLDATYEEFLEAGAPVNSAAFLDYLRQRDMLAQEAFVHAATMSSVKPSAAFTDALPERRDRYELLGPIGEGGMAEIRAARDRVLDRSVALKLLHPHQKRSDRLVRRFMQEAQVTGKLDHPHIVPVYGLHREVDGGLSFAMKLVRGRTVYDLICEIEEAQREGATPADAHSERSRLNILVRVCEAMAYAHDRGVLHRDLKPANLMIGDFGEVYVMDWGIAKLLTTTDTDDFDDDDELEPTITSTRDAPQTKVGSVVGTPAYMSPEQAMGLPLDPRSDVYALGAILFELVTLRKLVDGTTRTEVHEHAALGKRLDFANAGVKVDPGLRGIIDKATAYKADDRYASTLAFAADLKRYLADEEVEALPDNPVRMITRWLAHNRQVTFVLILLLLLGSAVIGGISLKRENDAVRFSMLRESQIRRLHVRTMERSHQIDAQFVRFSLMVSNLAASAAYLLENPQSNPTKHYANADFVDPETAPPDAMNSALYGKVISIDHPVYKLAPGVDFETHRDSLDRLHPLRDVYRRMFLDSRLEPAAVESAGQLRKLLTVDGVPARWAYVGTETGIMYSFPGKSGYPPEYDPRKRPWYELGANKKTAEWGNPYIDLQGQGMVLPCVTAIYDSQDRFVGVAGFEVTFDFIIRNFMQADETSPVAETYLLDDQGRIVIKSSDYKKGYETGKLHDALKLEPFDDPTVVARIKAGNGGLIQRPSEGGTELLVLYPIDTLGWYYVVRAPLEAVLKWNPQ